MCSSGSSIYQRLLNVFETILFHFFTLAVRDLQQTAAAPLNELSNLATPRRCTISVGTAPTHSLCKTLATRRGPQNIANILICLETTAAADTRAQSFDAGAPAKIRSAQQTNSKPGYATAQGVGKGVLSLETPNRATV